MNARLSVQARGVAGVPNVKRRRPEFSIFFVLSGPLVCGRVHQDNPLLSYSAEREAVRPLLSDQTPPPPSRPDGWCGQEHGVGKNCAPGGGGVGALRSCRFKRVDLWRATFLMTRMAADCEAERAPPSVLKVDLLFSARFLPLIADQLNGLNNT